MTNKRLQGTWIVENFWGIPKGLEEKQKRVEYRSRLIDAYKNDGVVDLDLSSGSPVLSKINCAVGVKVDAVPEFYPDDMVGVVMYDSIGYMHCCTYGRRPSSDSPTGMALQPSSYFAEVVIDVKESVVNHHVTAAYRADLVGTNLPRRFDLFGSKDELLILSPISESPYEEAWMLTTWTKSKDTSIYPMKPTAMAEDSEG